ncbi:hypothetical protein [Streptomyces sp. GESEQ-35]|uniref:hypothetical protein n=1 Tax=Streptomyces sp. GESEQ-35 TaxID=2812657 RepID=UPI001B33139A|nr:hypothetical protein [Streptomyces sp. GESEQ-35]
MTFPKALPLALAAVAHQHPENEPGTPSPGLRHTWPASGMRPEPPVRKVTRMSTAVPELRIRTLAPLYVPGLIA